MGQGVVALQCRKNDNELHKLLKKFVGWFGYKLVEKREIKNDRLLTKKT